MSNYEMIITHEVKSSSKWKQYVKDGLCSWCHGETRLFYVVPLISGPKSPLAHVGENSSTAHDADGDVAKSQGLKQVQSTKRFRLENLKKCMQ